MFKVSASLCLCWVVVCFSHSGVAVLMPSVRRLDAATVNVALLWSQLPCTTAAKEAAHDSERKSVDFISNDRRKGALTSVLFAPGTSTIYTRGKARSVMVDHRRMRPHPVTLAVSTPSLDLMKVCCSVLHFPRLKLLCHKWLTVSCGRETTSILCCCRLWCRVCRLGSSS